ncbi:MAG: hypothetical protein ABIP55_02740 [Tepidisphaeraceae bacterium]
MSDRSRFHLAVALLLSFCAASTVQAQKNNNAVITTQATENTETRFLRFVGDGTTGGVLETSDVTLRNEKGVNVRLVSAVHIGEESYFKGIQKSFAGTEVVLYEMVKAADTGPPIKGQKSDSGVSRLQHFLKDTLNLSFQLDQIDYTPKNFVHADLDAETFQKMQAARGESFATMMLSALMKSLADPSAMRSFDDEPLDMVDLMTRPDGERQIKLLLARHLGDIEKEAMGMDMLSGTVILTERNKAVMKVLDKQLKSGKKDIAVFYGAAHMPELADALEIRGFEVVKTTWRPAWDVKIRKDQPSAFQKLMNSAGQSLLEEMKKAQ